MKWLLIDMLASFSIGFVSHRARPRIRRLATEGWRSIVSYAVGTLVVILMGSLFYGHLPDIHNGRRYFISSLLSAIGVGGGVAAAWLLEDK